MYVVSLLVLLSLAEIIYCSLHMQVWQFPSAEMYGGPDVLTV